MKLIRIARGKRETIEEGTLKELTIKMNQLRQTTKGIAVDPSGKKYRITYTLEE